MAKPVILCFSTIAWNFLWHRHQELMTRFACDGYRIIYVEPIGIRAPQWGDRKRIISRVWNRSRAGRRGLRQVQANVWVHDPLLLPFQSAAWAHALNVRYLQGTIQRLISQKAESLPIIWSYVPTRLALDLIKRLPHRMLVYDCVDAQGLNPKGLVPGFREAEIELSRMADLVFVTSTALYEQERPLNERTYLVPNGVDPDWYKEPVRVPPDLEGIPRPRIGFFGSIDERVDFRLIDQVAGNHPEWSIVLIGVARTDVSSLRARENIIFLDAKPHAELPGYYAACDVLIIPYAVNAYTVPMYPTKLNEYLLVGKPTVVTALPEFAAFQEVLYIGHSPFSFEAAIQAGLAEGRDVERICRRRAVAKANSWAQRYAVIKAVMDERCRVLTDAA